MHVTLHACVVYQPSSGFLFPCVLHQRHLQGNENLALPAASLPCPGLTAITTATQHSVTDGGAQRWHCLEPKKKKQQKVPGLDAGL